MSQQASDLLALRAENPTHPELRRLAASILAIGLRDERLGL
ncbi:hypothetical protein [Burkholderia ubonensis]|nr:hypothetical protein [Burkholderia ubonensis]